MRAVVTGPSGELTVTDVDDPRAGPGEVVVRVAACGICGSDLSMLDANVVPPGVILGHEASGVVASVGEGVTEVRDGQPVAIHPFDPCGACEPCAAGATQRCVRTAESTIGLGLRPGAYAEHVVVSPAMLHVLPDAFPVELGAIAEPAAVALHGFRRSRFQPGMSVGVIGCGPIGLCAVMVAKALGAGPVWASDPNAYRADLAAAVGADHTGPSPREADVVIECAGAPGTVDLAVSATGGGGQVVLLAVNITGDTVYPFTWVTKEVEIVPCLGYTRAEYTDAADLVASGAVDASAIVTRRVGLDGTAGAVRGLLDGAADGKVLVIP